MPSDPSVLNPLQRDQARELGGRVAGKSSPVPDACAFGVLRAQCHNNCGYRCSRARAEHEAAARAAVAPTPAAVARARWAGTASPPVDGPFEVDVEPFGPVAYTASPSVAADHANCGTADCCQLCTPTQGSPAS